VGGRRLPRKVRRNQEIMVREGVVFF